MSFDPLSNPYSDGALQLREVPQSRPFACRQVDGLLAQHGLKRQKVAYMVGLYDEDEKLVACAALDGATIKLLAVDSAYHGAGLAARLVTHLLERATLQGLTNVFVFTRPANRQLFLSMGFVLIGETAEAIFLERDPQSLSAYLRSLEMLRARQPERGVSGCIVINGNPLTKGHVYLIEAAARQVDTLYILLLDDHERTLFSLEERGEMVEELIRLHRNDGWMERVEVTDGSHYCISQATFPSYFLKTVESATEAQIRLDLDIFCRHIAPTLGITRRFVGTEPADPLTARYNQLMKEILPARGIQVTEIERKRFEGEPLEVISAKRVRSALLAGDFETARALVPRLTVPHLLARWAGDCLSAELALTPKPGLIDRKDNGAHCDMTFQTMTDSIAALRPFFVKMALESFAEEDLMTYERIVDYGLRAEESMLAATGGVNTHKGALFAMGLTLIAAARLAQAEGPIRSEELQSLVRCLADDFPRAEGTHGEAVRSAYRLPTALDNAQAGYPQLFADWLPFYRLHRSQPEGDYLLLLRIMATLTDTNVIHRVGRDRADRVRAEAQALLSDFSVDGLAALNETFIQENISPGGAADLWALTRFVEGITR